MRVFVITAVAAGALLWAAPAASGQAVTAVTVTTTPTASRVGEPVELSAQVTVPQSSVTPTGTVQFVIDGAPLGPAIALSNGVASVVTSDLTAGTRSVVARYSSSSAEFADSSGSTNHVVSKWSSQVSVTVAPEPAVAGQPVTFTATVSGAGGRRPAGTVQFTDEGSGAIGPPVHIDAQGVARVSGRAGAGTYRVRAEYSGDSAYGASSATVTSTIQRAATVTTLTSSANPAAPGAQVVFTITVDIVEPGNVAPFGSLQMTVNGEPLGDAFPLEGFDQVTLTVRAPTIAGSDVVGVSYSGDANTLPSSAAINQVVTAATTAPLSATAPLPTVRQAVTPAQLKRMTAPLVNRLKRRGLRALNGARLTFTAPTAGTLQQTVRAGSLLASASRTFNAPGRGTLTLRLTAAGRRQLTRAGSSKLTITTTFRPSGGTAVRVVERVTARRSARSASAWRVMASRLTRT